jgi:hypothetical protein
VDGKYFYYHMASAPELWKVPVEGGEETLVMSEGTNFMNYWALGTQGLYFNAVVDNQPIVKLFRFETGQSRQIAVLPGTPHRVSLPADGRWLLYNQVDGRESDIMLIDNFR